MESRMK